MSLSANIGHIGPALPVPLWKAVKKVLQKEQQAGWKGHHGTAATMAATMALLTTTTTMAIMGKSDILSLKIQLISTMQFYVIPYLEKNEKWMKNNKRF